MMEKWIKGLSGKLSIECVVAYEVSSYAILLHVRYSFFSQFKVTILRVQLSVEGSGTT